MITQTIWFTQESNTIGIVQWVQEHQREQYRQTGTADFVYYIGVGQGFDEKTDATYISEYGAPFPADAGAALFGP